MACPDGLLRPSCWHSLHARLRTSNRTNVCPATACSTTLSSHVTRIMGGGAMALRAVMAGSPISCIRSTLKVFKENWRSLLGSGRLHSFHRVQALMMPMSRRAQKRYFHHLLPDRPTA
ncbi:hypothetical protein NP493_121g04005 [Ridgeia piscesae]|uniref:Uncharacterized protein n=1 Tax=Ridgeia piscesae TaxID=27915 RepID=A0AAD9P600_RIDPI|nr:hypothetical protein NP493_121g04005 [Ridgeia piscesae]